MKKYQKRVQQPQIDLRIHCGPLERLSLVDFEKSPKKLLRCAVWGGKKKVPKSPFLRKNCLTCQKIDFFKVRDIDTPIQPQKKKHQTNVSSASKTF